MYENGNAAWAADGGPVEAGKFYFISREFYDRYAAVGGKMMSVMKEGEGFRPHLCIQAAEAPGVRGLSWFVPVSSRVVKYEAEAALHRRRYGVCDKIDFLSLFGARRAALIQNLFPCPARYVEKAYRNAYDLPAEALPEDFERIRRKAFKLAALHKEAPYCGFLFNDVVAMVRELLRDGERARHMAREREEAVFEV